MRGYKTVQKSREFFYTAEQEWKQVTKEEFTDFINTYPRRLEGDCYAVCDPPLVTYNDFELANRWPYSVVAKYNAGEGDDYYGKDYKNTYWVCMNHDDCFQSKTGRFVGDEDDLKEEAELRKFWDKHRIKSIDSAGLYDKTTGEQIVDLSMANLSLSQPTEETNWTYEIYQ